MGWRIFNSDWLLPRRDVKQIDKKQTNKMPQLSKVYSNIRTLEKRKNVKCRKKCRPNTKEYLWNDDKFNRNATFQKTLVIFVKHFQIL